MKLSPEIKAKITKSFAAQGLMQTLGAKLRKVEQGAVEIQAPILPETSQQHGFAHAGLTFSIGDSAAGYAALSVMEADKEVVTADMKISLLAPAKGDVLIAKGQVLKPGRRLVFVKADIFARQDNDETLVATMLGTMVPV